MRRIKARRRFKLILASLLIICFVLFLENRIEAFVPQVKNFAELKIEETLGGRFKLSITSIDGGILQPLVFNDIKIRDKKDALLFPSLVVNSIRTNYRIWDVFFKLKDGSLMASLLPKDSRTYINFATRNNQIAGFVMLEGGLADSKVRGYVNLCEKERIDFSGQIEGSDFELGLKSGTGGIVRTEGTLSDDDELMVKCRANHLKVCGMDIVCDAILKNRIKPDPANIEKAVIEGDFETKNLILNYKPFSDLKASYKISDGLFDVSILNVGDDFKIHGKLNLKRPYSADIVVFADNANLSRVFASLNAQGAASVLSGTMNGKFELKGPIGDLSLNARIEIRKGTVGIIDFDYLSANLRGEGPIIRIEDSRITRPSGYFVLAGEMDLRKIGKNSVFEDIKMVTDDSAIIWDFKDTTKMHNVQEVLMKKKMSEEVNLGFKKFFADEKVDESIRDTDEVEFEYKLHPHESLKMMLGQDKDFFGFEHKDRF